MSLTLEEVRDAVSGEEPNYPWLAKLLGTDALSALTELFRIADPLLASKTTYLASVIGGTGALPIMEMAAGHADPTVRVSVAAGARNLQEGHADSLLARLLGDHDSGVQVVALESVAELRATGLQKRVNDLSQDAQSEFVRRVARDVLRRLDEQ